MNRRKAAEKAIARLRDIDPAASKDEEIQMNDDFEPVSDDEHFEEHLIYEISNEITNDPRK